MTQQPSDFGPPAKDFMERPSRARYEKVRAILDLKYRRREPEADRMMVEVIEALWENFADNPYAGCGFYILSADGTRFAAGHHRGKRGGASLGLTGARALAVQSGHPAIVRDEGHARIAVPVYDREDKLWAVLEAVSDKLDAFDDMDKRWLERVAKAFQHAKRVGGGC